MREITTHRIFEKNDKSELVSDKHETLSDLIRIEVGDEPRDGPAVRQNVSYHFWLKHGTWERGGSLRFNGNPLKERTSQGDDISRPPTGINDEVLLAIIIDRLEVQQKGPNRQDQNDAALVSLREALNWLHERTKVRIDAGVEGRLKE